MTKVIDPFKNFCYVKSKESKVYRQVPLNAFKLLSDSFMTTKGQTINDSSFKNLYLKPGNQLCFSCTGQKSQKTVIKTRQPEPKRDYVVIVFKINHNHKFYDIILQIRKLLKCAECDYLFYPNINQKNVWYFIIPTDMSTNSRQYKKLVKLFMRHIATSGIVDKTDTQNPSFPIPIINSKYTSKYISKIERMLTKYKLSPCQLNHQKYHIDYKFLLKNASSSHHLKNEKLNKAEKNNEKLNGLHQHMIDSAQYLVSPTNPDKTGFKLFKSSVNPNKVEKYYDSLKKLERESGIFESKYPNPRGSNFPKKAADKLSRKLNMAQQTYKRNKDTLDKRNRIILSIANANIKGTINNKTADKIISIFDEVNGDDSKIYKNQFKTACLELKNDPNLKMKAEPISEALRLYQRYDNSISISAQFRVILGNYKSNSKITLNDAFNQIKLIYPPALLDITTQDTDKIVVIFDPLHGFWTHNINIFRGLLRTIKPTASSRSVQTLISSLGSYAFSRDRYIKPYHGSRYLLYKNGVYDTAQPVNPKTKLPDHLISLNSNIVHDLHFTERAYHQINLKVDPPLPHYDALSYKPANSTYMWSPLRLLNGYSNFDNHIRSYFLFCLSLGLFSTHNFSVSLDIQGPSGFGKTMLSTIYETIYGASRVNIAPFANLNGQFVFTSYKDNTAIIWFNETNTDAKPLDSRGISTYDSLSDDQARFQVKNKGDHLVDDPPMVFLDGTDFLKTEHPDTGPYRRTLVMKLPNNLTEAQKSTFYTNDFKNLLSKKDVVEWLNWHMIMAYRKKTSISDRVNGLKLNMTSKRIKQIVPKKALDWREYLRNHDTNVTEWFEDVLEPCLVTTVNDPNPSKDLSWVQKSFMYHLYQHHMLTQYNQHINDSNGNEVTRFWDAFKEIADENNWELVRIKEGNQPRSKSRRRIKTLARTNINFTKYQDIETLPSDYTQHKTIRKQPFGFSTAWYYIEKQPDKTGTIK